MLKNEPVTRHPLAGTTTADALLLEDPSLEFVEDIEAKQLAKNLDKYAVDITEKAKELLPTAQPLHRTASPAEPWDDLALEQPEETAA